MSSWKPDSISGTVLLEVEVVDRGDLLARDLVLAGAGLDRDRDVAVAHAAAPFSWRGSRSAP